MKVFIKAYTQLNLGDDLFVKILCERYPKHDFYIVCDKRNEAPFKIIPNLSIVNSPPSIIDDILFKLNINYNIFRMISEKVASRCDITVHIGGSIFIENIDWRNQVKNYNKITELTSDYYIIGCNFGPFSQEEYYSEYKKIFSKTKDICFRDEYSFNLFKDVNQTRMASDIVFAIKHEITNIKQKNEIIVSVIDLQERKDLNLYTEKYEVFISDLTIKLVANGYRVVLMSFCSKEGDEKAVNRIFNNLPEEIKEETKKFMYRGNLDQALLKISSSKGIIATRFHSLILALAFNLPVYPFIYSSKTSNIIHDIHFKGKFARIEDIDSININDIITQVTSEEFKNVDDQIISAQEHFLKLDQVLEL